MSVWSESVSREQTHGTVEPHVGESELPVDTAVTQNPIPASDPLGAVPDVVVAQIGIDDTARYDGLLCKAVDSYGQQRVVDPGQDVVVIAVPLGEPALEPAGEVVGGVGGTLGPEQVE